MFKKLFGGGAKTPAPSPRPAPRPTPRPTPRPHSSGEHPATTALVNTIRAQSATDPHIGAKIGAREVLQRLLEGLSQGPERRVHAESLLTALGALAGYACQMSIRAQSLRKGAPEFSAFITMEAGGQHYFFGDPPNQLLLESEHSVWSLAAAQAQSLGLDPLPKASEVAGHVASTIGTPAFGIPRLPEGHRPGERPIDYVRNLWPALFPTVKLLCPEPTYWPLLYAIAAQQAMEMAKATMTADLLYALVMEAAAPMAKVDLDRHP